ncbi:MAG: T9SS type A sorting domain-containing protein [Ignavibacteriae bacterium]|nr:T9SS type A sorting domain-containing protein [Ignavibacteriota bacterium]
MKKIILLFLTLTAFSGVSFSQWSIQYTSSPSQTVMSLKFFDVNTGYHSGILYSGSTMNIYKTTNGGVNYVAQNSNFTSQRFMSIFMLHPDTVFISGNYGKILRTVNGGNNWIVQYSDTSLQFWGLFFVNSNTGFVSGSNGRIMKTTNKGDNWIIQATPTSTALDGIYFINETTGYVGGANIFLKTTDAGQTWINKVGSFISPFETAQSVYFSDANTGIYSTNAARIVRTTDGGDTWNLVYSTTSGGAVWGLAFPTPLTGYGCTNVGTVLRTTDGGLNWIQQSTPLTENLYEISFPTVNTGYISTWSGKILKTTNGGATYINNTNKNIPEKYSLSQNYPNPFNPSTNIKFSIKKPGFTTLKVYNALGKEERLLVNDFLEAGEFETMFDGGKLSSGLYFYKITTGNFTDTKKMLMIK